MTNILLDVKNLQVTFNILRGQQTVKIHAVRDVSFSLQRGEILGIVGESGSGKSVCTSAITGLLPANANVSGQVFFDGTELIALSKGDKKNLNSLREFRGKKIGMIFQEPGRSFDPLQNMFSVFFETFRNSNKYITKEEATKKAIELLEETGIENAADRLQNFPHQFSGGQLQRIGIALSLAQNCELLIADEPTTALDVTIQSQIIDLLLSLQKNRGISIIFISHNIDLVAQISNKIIVMYGGLIMESAQAKKIQFDPQHPYTKALISASPVFGSHYSETPLKPIPGKVTDPANPEKGCPFFSRCPLVQKRKNNSQVFFSCDKTLPELKFISAKKIEENESLVRCSFI